ncbi:hypothetical protein Pcinc_005128 [Petrolisthes cinctipes]|uniref:Uncharacterized protein n=1 Tax=Petrolisthes cinctipes TaxID=88211 RepID=A0AAE1KZF4_PETCI|nr:hypothetical protein Pcinc_005128 [Petrolisthes cinctipes]
MDSTLINTLLESQERAYKSAMDTVVKQMNDRIMKLESTVSDLTTSLQFSQREIDDLKSTIKELGKEKQFIKVKMDQQAAVINSSKSEIVSLGERCNYMEDYSRRNNIRISGVEEPSSGETWEHTAATVLSLLDDKLQLPGVEMERAHRVGQRRDAGPRPIVARFSRYGDRETVMRSARKLRGTYIYINDDLCAASQAIENAQMPQLKQARAHGKVAYFRYTKLFIKESPVRGICRPRNETLTVGPGRTQGGAGVAAEDGGAQAPAAAVATAARVVAGADADSGGGDSDFPPLSQGATRRSERKNKK